MRKGVAWVAGLCFLPELRARAWLQLVTASDEWPGCYHPHLQMDAWALPSSDCMTAASLCMLSTSCILIAYPAFLPFRSPAATDIVHTYVLLSSKQAVE